ncbi:MAG: hypothetical protein ABI857_07555, partial [Acidobacteriota bacterium]
SLLPDSRIKATGERDSDEALRAKFKDMAYSEYNCKARRNLDWAHSYPMKIDKKQFRLSSPTGSCVMVEQNKTFDCKDEIKKVIFGE